ncbi:hypothetical protein TWF106_008505 [Orbilia oligospora]|uniref:Uncharacterized protein n=1 Tax=Orbilia oligospora TaxID=2813651 RepID=A0A7C8QMY4_ORBOL|nr:hypothetical protein TWF106_008505 [Orbilia oligospora]
MFSLMNTLRRTTFQSSIRAKSTANRGTRMMHNIDLGAPEAHSTTTGSDFAISTLIFGLFAVSGQILKTYKEDKEAWDSLRMSMYGFKCDIRILERDLKILEGLVRIKEMEEGAAVEAKNEKEKGAPLSKESNRTLISKIQTSFNIPQILGQTALAIGLYTLATTTIYIGSISAELSDFYVMWTRSLDEEFEKARVEWMLRSILTENIDPTGVIDDCTCVTTTNAQGVICTDWEDEVD